MGFFSDVWNAVCAFVLKSFEFLLRAIDAALEFAGKTLESVCDMFSNLFSGIFEAIRRGLAKLYVIIVPAKKDCTIEGQKEVYECLEKMIAAKGKKIKKFRLAVKTDADNKVLDVKGFFNSGNSSMAGLDDDVRREGVVNVTL